MRYIIFILLSLIGLTGYGKKAKKSGLDGIYDTGGTRRMEIRNDSLIIYYNSLEHLPCDLPPDPIDYYPVAICSFEKIGHDFIEINNKEYVRDKAFKNISINKEEQDSARNSAVTFIIPESHEQYEVEIKYMPEFIPKFEQFQSAVTVNGKCTFVLPPIGDDKSYCLTFTVKPIKKKRTDLKIYNGYEYSYWGRYIYYKTGENITISLPGITESLQNQINITGEYIQILPSGDLKWRGDKFKKIIQVNGTTY